MNKVVSDNPQGILKYFKWFVSLLALSYLYYTLFIRHNAFEILGHFKNLFNNHTLAMILIVGLMPINWLIEAVKWRYLTSKVYPISLLNALKGVLMGVSVGLFTPNGVGEFAGKMLVIPDRYKQASVTASMAGSMAQLAITITIGGACIIFFIGKYISITLIPYAIVAALLTVILGFVLYFKLPKLAQYAFRKIKWFNRYQQFVQTFDQFNQRTLFVAYLFSLIRYLVFCVQLCLIVWVSVPFSPSMSLSALFFLMPVYFYIQSLVPSIALGEIGIRGAVLSFLLPTALFSVPIITATTTIWIINIVIPALAGLLISFFVKPETIKA